MSETNESSGLVKPLALYLLQLLLACPLILVAGLPFFTLFSYVGFTGEHPHHTHFAGYDFVVCLFMGIAGGWIIGRKAPTLAPTGRWIWVLPAFLVFPEMVTYGQNSQAVPWLPELFFITGGNEGVGVFLMGSAISTAGYSTGMALAGKKSHSPKLTLLSPFAGAVTRMTVVVAIIGILIAFAHTFEQSRIERWSRVRFVIGRPGLSLFKDGNQLCLSPTSNTGFLLPAGTVVEQLEQGVCSSDHLIDKNALRPTGSWGIERVRVLGDSKPGAEGWVASYGLLEE